MLRAVRPPTVRPPTASPLTVCRSTRPSRWATLLLPVLCVAMAACSGSDSGNLVPLDTPAPGVLYVATTAGTIQQVTPATGEASVFASPADNDAADSTDGALIIDVGPAEDATAVQALMTTSRDPFLTSAFAVTADGLAAIDSQSLVLACIDPHPAASKPLAHEAGPTRVDGTRFEAVPLDGTDIAVEAADLELLSVACPRWSADRDMVATAVPSRSGDPSSIVTTVQSAQGERHEVAFDGCGTTPTSFSPDDRFLALAITCYSAAWDNSGLYLLPVADLAERGDLSSLTKLGEGLFGRTSWHPDGGWIAAVHADAIEEQNIAQNLGVQPTGLQVIEVATSQTVDLPLADADTPTSITWLDEPLAADE